MQQYAVGSTRQNYQQVVEGNSKANPSKEEADAASRLATGGGFRCRELYSDHDEAIFDATRPILFNAIPDLDAARPDFLDRAVIAELLDMTPELCRDKAQFWREFEQVRHASWVLRSMRLLRALKTCPKSRLIINGEWRTSLHGRAVAQTF